MENKPDKNTTGEIALFAASDTAGLAAGRKRIGCIVEAPAFYPKLTAEQNLEYYRIQRGVPDRMAVQKALETVRLTDTGKKNIRRSRWA